MILFHYPLKPGRATALANIRKELDMTSKKAIAAVRAEAERLGGRLAFSDGNPVVHIAHRGLSGQVVDTYLTLAQAQELDQFPPTAHKPDEQGS